MEQITPDQVTHAQVQSGIIKCECGCDFLTNITINVLRDTPTDLFSKVKAMNSDDVNIVECIRCGKRRLPPLLYQGMTQRDIKLMKYINSLIEDWNKKNETPSA